MPARTNAASKVALARNRREARIVPRGAHESKRADEPDRKCERPGGHAVTTSAGPPSLLYGPSHPLRNLRLHLIHCEQHLPVEVLWARDDDADAAAIKPGLDRTENRPPE